MKFEDHKKRGDRIEKRERMLEQLLADRLKLFELVDQHLLPCGDNLVLLTLKGHLIIENLLDINLCRLLAIDSLPTEDELEFSQKLRLLQAVVVKREPGPNADLFCAIRMLNKTRNELAHNLRNLQETESAVRRIVQSYQSKSDAKLSSQHALTDQLARCIRRLCRFLDDVGLQTFKLEW
jgi:hypothetical protein